jgi:hypothetical protein
MWPCRTLLRLACKPLARPLLITLAPGQRIELSPPVVRASTRRTVDINAQAVPRVTYWRAGESLYTQASIPARISWCGHNEAGDIVERTAPMQSWTVTVFNGV